MRINGVKEIYHHHAFLYYEVSFFASFAMEQTTKVYPSLERGGEERGKRRGVEKREKRREEREREEGREILHVKVHFTLEWRNVRLWSANFNIADMPTRYKHADNNLKIALRPSP